MIKIKTLLQIILFVFGLQNASAQLTNSTPEFIDYSKTEDSLLLRVIRSQKTISFGSSNILRKNSAVVKENTLVNFKSAKPGTKEKTAEDIAVERKESVIMIARLDKANNAKGAKVQVIATGIVLSEDGVCATNYHVMRPFLDEKMKPNNTDSLMFIANSKGEVCPIREILSYNIDGDIAIFKIDPLNTRMKAIPLGKDAYVGAKVYAFTHPDGYFYYFSTGNVARNTAINTKGVFGNRMDITADYAKGSSGGPIIDKFGNLVGMVSTTNSIYYRENQYTNQQTNLQMVVKSTIPVQTFRRLIGSNTNSLK